MKVLKSGILSTIQDAGRFGHRSSGIGPGGVMDIFAFEMLNCLLGNERNEAVVEMHFPAAEFLFEENTVFAIAGGDFDATLNDVSVPCWKTVRVKAGDILRFAALRKGYRVYFSVKGGFNADTWLGSCSTNLSVRKGGYWGRALMKEDVLVLKNKEGYFNIREQEIPALLIADIYDDPFIYCIEGPEYCQLTEESRKQLLSEVFTIDVHSNRIGYRLKQKKISCFEAAGTMLSSAVSIGTIQVVPDGGLIILMADHQTTGGYPRVLSVVSSSLPKLAQCKPGDQICFKLITPAEAEEKYISLYQMLRDHSSDENTY